MYKCRRVTRWTEQTIYVAQSRTSTVVRNYKVYSGKLGTRKSYRFSRPSGCGPALAAVCRRTWSRPPLWPRLPVSSRACRHPRLCCGFRSSSPYFGGYDHRCKIHHWHFLNTRPVAFQPALSQNNNNNNSVIKYNIILN